MQSPAAPPAHNNHLHREFQFLQETKHKRRLEELAEDLDNHKLTKDEAVQRSEQLARSIKARDHVMDEQQGLAISRRNSWQEHVVSRLAHLSMPLDELLQRREVMRSAFRTLPEMAPEEWRYVVVVGPAGKGKSSFIREQLQRHGYPGERGMQQVMGLRAYLGFGGGSCLVFRAWGWCTCRCR